LVFKPLRKKPVTIPPLKNTLLLLEDVVSVEMQTPPRLLPWVKSFAVYSRDGSKLTFRTGEPELWVAEINALFSARHRGWDSVRKEPPAS
jgi:hypothetical protein